MARSARLLDLIQTLRRHRCPVSASRLGDELGVSLRTVYRDIATLVAQGAPIEGEAGLGYVLRPGFFLPPLMFSEDEVDAVILGLRFVARRGDQALQAAAEDAMAKVVALLPPALEEAASASALFAAPGAAAEASPIAVIRQAMRVEAKLRLRYRDKADQVTERIVWPVAIGFFDEAEMLAAWCELRSGFRHFRLDQIIAAEACGERLPKRRRVLLAAWRSHEDIGRD